MNLNAPTGTTAGNAGKVASYGGVAWCAMYIIDRLLNLNLDGPEFGAFTAGLGAASGTFWNFVKDQGWIKDNR